MESKRKNMPNEQPKVSRVLFEDAFQKFAENDANCIQVKSVKHFLETLNLSQAETDSLLHHIQMSMTNKEGEDPITLEEMTSFLQEKFSVVDEHYNKVTFTFELFDIDAKGYIDAADLRRISKELGQDITKQEVKDMLDRAGSNPQRDRVYKNDFKRVMENLSLF